MGNAAAYLDYAPLAEPARTPEPKPDTSEEDDKIKMFETVQGMLINYLSVSSKIHRQNREKNTAFGELVAEVRDLHRMSRGVAVAMGIYESVKRKMAGVKLDYKAFEESLDVEWAAWTKGLLDTAVKAHERTSATVAEDEKDRARDEEQSMSRAVRFLGDSKILVVNNLKARGVKNITHFEFLASVEELLEQFKAAKHQKEVDALTKAAVMMEEGRVFEVDVLVEGGDQDADGEDQDDEAAEDEEKKIHREGSQRGVASGGRGKGRGKASRGRGK